MTEPDDVAPGPPPDDVAPALTPDDLDAVIAMLGFDPTQVSAVILTPGRVHAIAATLVEPPPTPTEEATDADT